jgi:choline kinase
MNGPTIVINAAGRGSRLGFDKPKSLVNVLDQPILYWQLRLLCQRMADVRIVVGYRGGEVASLARSLRPDIRIIVNNEWQTTRTGGSLSRGAAGVQGRVVSLDGDLLVHPDDFRLVTDVTDDTIGITPVNSTEPVHAMLDDRGRCRRLAYGAVSDFEWTGLVNFDPRRVPAADGHVFEMIAGILPCAAKSVRCWEVDTVADLERALRGWKVVLAERQPEWKKIA